MRSKKSHVLAYLEALDLVIHQQMGGFVNESNSKYDTYIRKGITADNGINNGEVFGFSKNPSSNGDTTAA